jgi:hypothetical protein
MGFDELGQSSMRNNRSLLRSTIGKYFRNAKGMAVNTKTELSAPRLKDADGQRHRKIRSVYIGLLIVIIIVIGTVLWLL